MTVPELDGALRRLQGALGRLERAVSERFEGEGRGDLETELQLMQDDRARLAVELEGATARLARLEAATGHVEERVESAIAAVNDALGATAPEADDGPPSSLAARQDA